MIENDIQSLGHVVENIKRTDIARKEKIAKRHTRIETDIKNLDLVVLQEKVLGHIVENIKEIS
jgi:hypothetical protein